MNNLSVKIVGTGSYLPERVLSNFDLEKIVDTSDEWITTRTGIKERRIARGDEYTSDMGAIAAHRALEDAKIKADDIDFIIVATLTPDFPFPSTACLIQKELAARNAAALDIQAACSGYVYGLLLAKNLVEQGQYKNVLLVASEKLSSIVDYKDRTTCILFGDGAAACVIAAKEKGLEIKGISLGADGNLAELLILPGGGCRNPPSKKTVEQGLHYLRMAGSEVFRHAIRRMETAATKCLDLVNMEKEAVDWLIPHQANERIIDAVAKRFNLPAERIYKKIVQMYGNTSASSVGLALDALKREKSIKDGENILLTVFGAGFTWGAAMLTQRS